MIKGKAPLNEVECTLKNQIRLFLYVAQFVCTDSKPGLREPQLPDERNVTFVSSIVERHRCALPSQQRRSTTRE